MNLFARIKRLLTPAPVRFEPLAFPPPYQSMVAINSDVEWTSWSTQLDLLKILNDKGLETAFTYWFYGDPKATWRLFENDGRNSDAAARAFDLIRAGHFDTIHSFGGILTGAGSSFSRSEIEYGYNRLRQEGITSDVYSNHGSVKDIQNIGGPWISPRIGPIDGSNYQEGDLPELKSYHLDLTLSHGVRFFWLDIDCVSDPVCQLQSEDPTKSLFTWQRSRDGQPIVRFRRTSCGQIPFPFMLGAQIDAILACRTPGYSVVYNHLGADRLPNGDRIQNVPPYFSRENLAAMDRLSRAQREGRILVTTTSRLLNHAFMQMTKPWTVMDTGDAIVVELAREVRFGEVVLSMKWQHYDGLTFRTNGRREVIFAMGVEKRRPDRWGDDKGKYVGLRWRRNLAFEGVEWREQRRASV